MKYKTPPALILCCVDYRYIEAIQAFVKRRLSVATYDLKTDAGGTKALLDGNAAVRTWMLHNIRLAYQRHGVRTVVLVHHEDCAAYGGSTAFKDCAKETAFHAQQLAMAASLLRSAFPRLTVRMFYAHGAPPVRVGRNPERAHGRKPWCESRDRASRRIVFAEIVGSRPRHRAARRVCTRG